MDCNGVINGGGNSSTVQDKIVMGADNSQAVTQLSSTSGAFTAIKSDGSVVTWGNSDVGGTNSVDFSANPIQGIVQANKL